MEKILQANSNHPRSEEEKLRIIAAATKAYEAYLDALQFDWRNDPNSDNTPERVAKAFVRDLASGCYNEPPKVTHFPSRGYNGIIFEGNIPMSSLCAHHHLNIDGVVHVAYIPAGNVAGLSKLNRIVDFYSRRPQIQEDLTTQLHDAINDLCAGNKGVAVMVSATHSCVSCRGVRHIGCEMKTSKLSGDFMADAATRAEFYTFISDLKR